MGGLVDRRAEPRDRIRLTRRRTACTARSFRPAGPIPSDYRRTGIRKGLSASALMCAPPGHRVTFDPGQRPGLAAGCSWVTGWEGIVVRAA
jgi:hypothetical protein